MDWEIRAFRHRADVYAPIGWEPFAISGEDNGIPLVWLKRPRGVQYEDRPKAANPINEHMQKTFRNIELEILKMRDAEGYNESYIRAYVREVLKNAKRKAHEALADASWEDRLEAACSDFDPKEKCGGKVTFVGNLGCPTHYMKVAIERMESIVPEKYRHRVEWRITPGPMEYFKRTCGELPHVGWKYEP